MKTFIITGATSGIGLETAKYLSKRGHNIIITGRSQEKLDNAMKLLSGGVFAYICDSGNIESIERFSKKIIENNIKVDGIFINAGIFEAMSFTGTSPESLNTTMDINFKGSFFTIQYLLPILQNPCSIVLNTSIVTTKSFAMTSAYTASKCALEGISKVLNQELAEKGIRINMVSPGVTRTPIQEKSGMNTEQIESVLEDIQSSSPLGRVIQVSDIAPIVDFLFSDGSLALRDQTIQVEGGTTL